MTLPGQAKAEKWPVHMNHCLMRVALDAYWQCCWYQKLDKTKGALKSMTIPQIENVIALGQRMAREGKPYVSRLNQQSLVYRGKSGTKAVKQESGTKASASVKQESQAVNSGSISKLASDDNREPNLRESDTTADVNLHASGPNTTDASGDSQKAHSGAALKVEAATTGRAACRGCSQKISKAAYRIGMQAWAQGRQVTVWHHPMCFVQGVVRVEKVDRGSAARCKSTGEKFAKGDLRLVLQVGTTKHYHTIKALKKLLKPVYDLPEVQCSEEPVAKLCGIQGLGGLNAHDSAIVGAVLS